MVDKNLFALSLKLENNELTGLQGLFRLAICSLNLNVNLGYAENLNCRREIFKQKCLYDKYLNIEQNPTLYILPTCWTGQIKFSNNTAFDICLIKGVKIIIYTIIEHNNIINKIIDQHYQQDNIEQDYRKDYGQLITKGTFNVEQKIGTYHLNKKLGTATHQIKCSSMHQVIFYNQ